MYADTARPEEYWVPESVEVCKVLLEVCLPAMEAATIAEVIVYCSKYGELTFDEPDLAFLDDRPPTPPKSVVVRLWVSVIGEDDWMGRKKWIEESVTTLWVRKCGERSRKVPGRWVDPTIM